MSVGWIFDAKHKKSRRKRYKLATTWQWGTLLKFFCESGNQAPYTLTWTYFSFNLVRASSTV